MKKSFFAKDNKKYSLSDDKSLLNPNEIIALYTLAKWGKKEDYKLSEIKKALKNISILYYVKDEKGKVVGFIRALSDFAYSTYISDVIVHPDYQKIGIGKRLIKEVIKQSKNTPIFLHSFGDNEIFFSNCKMKFKQDMKVFTYMPQDKM